MSTQHTPEYMKNWRPIANKASWGVYENSGKRICTVNSDFMGQEKIARLIAAAPELLEALQRAQVTLLSASRGRLTPDEINDAAYEASAAIAKATGGA